MTVAVAAVFFAIMGLLLREFRWQGVSLFLSVAAVVLLKEEWGMFSSFRSFLQEITPNGLLSETCTAAIRIVGIGCVCGFAQETCRDLSAEAPGRAVAVAARLEILAVCLPYIRSIGEMGLSLLS